MTRKESAMSGRESGKIVEKSGPNSIRWLPKMCRFAGKVLAQFKLDLDFQWHSSNSAELSFRRLLEGTVLMY